MKISLSLKVFAVFLFAGLVLPIKIFAVSDSIEIIPLVKDGTTYKYQIKGAIPWEKFDLSAWTNDFDATGYTIKIKTPTGEVALNLKNYNISTFVYDGPDMYKPSLTFDGVISLDLTGPATVDVVWDTVGDYFDEIAVSTTVDLSKAREQMDQAAANGNNNNNNGNNNNGNNNNNNQNGYTPPSQNSSATLVALGGDPSCSDWSKIKDADKIASCFANWGKVANRVLIGIGVVGSLLLLPFVGYLLGSGNPGNIEKGWDYLQSWLWGIGLLLLSGYIINIFGKDLFGVS